MIIHNNNNNAYSGVGVDKNDSGSNWEKSKNIPEHNGQNGKIASGRNNFNDDCSAPLVTSSCVFHATPYCSARDRCYKAAPQSLPGRRRSVKAAEKRSMTSPLLMLLLASCCVPELHSQPGKREGISSTSSRYRFVMRCGLSLLNSKVRRRLVNLKCDNQRYHITYMGYKG
jgi:hypothetical protein